MAVAVAVAMVVAIVNWQMLGNSWAMVVAMAEVLVINRQSMGRL